MLLLDLQSQILTEQQRTEENITVEVVTDALLHSQTPAGMSEATLKIRQTFFAFKSRSQGLHLFIESS